jgi:hypothetical protein
LEFLSPREGSREVADCHGFAGWSGMSVHREKVLDGGYVREEIVTMANRCCA